MAILGTLNRNNLNIPVEVQTARMMRSVLQLLLGSRERFRWMGPACISETPLDAYISLQPPLSPTGRTCSIPLRTPEYFIG